MSKMNQIQSTSKVKNDLNNLSLSSLKHFTSLKDMQEDFVLFTDSLLYVYGGLKRDLLLHFIHDNAIPIAGRPVAVDLGRKIFDIPKIKINSERNLWSCLYAIKIKYWQDLSDYLCSIAPFSIATGFFAKFNFHDLIIPDYCILNQRKSLEEKDVPYVVIKAFDVFSNVGSFMFTSPQRSNEKCKVNVLKPLSTVVQDSKIVWTGT